MLAGGVRLLETQVEFLLVVVEAAVAGSMPQTQTVVRLQEVVAVVGLLQQPVLQEALVGYSF